MNNQNAQRPEQANPQPYVHPRDHHPNRLQSLLYGLGLDSFGPHPNSDDPNILLPLEKHLHSFHTQMIALGGSIGTGFLIGTGEALATAGPIPLLAGFSWVGVAAYFTIHSLGELTVLYPVPGAYITFSGRFLDQAWGAAMGWNYGLQWLTVLPLELIAASITLKFWNQGSVVPPAGWVAIFLSLITFINFFGVWGYGNFEALLCVLKIIAIVGFLQVHEPF